MYPEKPPPPEGNPDALPPPWTDMGPEKRYRVKARLGQGGMAVVHKAYDRILRRNVAVKLLRRDKISDDENNIHRFMEEAQITAQIQHPGVVSLFDAGTMKDRVPFFTMNLVSGLTLEDILDDAACAGTEWTRFRLLQVFLRVCETLAFAHSRNVIHRDLKPSNIMVGEYGEVIVMDWGISKILEPGEKKRKKKPGPPRKEEETQGHKVTSVRTSESLATRYGQMIGTPHYMSPEQARGKLDEVDEGSDIFSLGVILYEILTGGLPFEEEVYQNYKFYELEATPPHKIDPTVAADLSRICMTAMAPQRKRRFPAVKDLIRELHLYLDRGSRFERRRIAGGELVIRKGENAKDAYLILRGKAEVFDETQGKRISYATLKKGDTFGEIAVFTGSKRTANVKALTDMEVLVFDRQKVQEELDKVQPWMGEMINNLAEKLARLDLKYADSEAERRG